MKRFVGNLLRFSLHTIWHAGTIAIIVILIVLFWPVIELIFHFIVIPFFIFWYLWAWIPAIWIGWKLFTWLLKKTYEWSG
jgi:hypothetical protein